MARRLILLAGPSGSGKSRLARRVGAPSVRLDDFYRAAGDPALPIVDGLVDWDDVRSWQPSLAAEALEELLACGRAVVPHYVISANAAEGTHQVAAPDGQVLVAEGIFAPELLEACRARGIDARALYLDRPSWLVFALRLRRDLAQHRKPPLVLLRRGWRLMRHDGELRARCVALGFEPLSMRRAERALRAEQATLSGVC